MSNDGTFENMDQAAAALAAANNLPDGTDTAVVPDGEGNVPVSEPSFTRFDPEISRHLNQPTEQPTTVPGDAQQQTPSVQEPGVPASRDIDISGLPQEARDWLSAREREMQAVMTQRTQEAAEVRRQAEQSMAFLNELSTNPYFQQQVVSELSGALQAQGFSPAQANAEAGRQVGQAIQSGQPGVQQPDAFGGEDFDDDPYLREIQGLKATQDQLVQYLATQEQRQQAERLDAHYDRQLAAIQSANPNWGDDDLKRVISLGYSTGDLLTAAEEYNRMQEAVIEAYTQSKSTVPASLNQPGVTAPAATSPEPFKGLDDPRLEAAARTRLMEALNIP